MKRYSKNVQFDRNHHGGLYDRGSADAHYGRERYPHWFPAGTYKGKAITNLTEAEIAEYNAGYDSEIFGAKYK